MSDQEDRYKVTEAAIFTDIPGDLVATDVFDEPVNVTDGESVQATLIIEEFDPMGQLVADGYHFQILYDGNEFTVTASLPEWHELFSWQLGYAIVPTGKGATLADAYQDLQEFLKDFVPGQIEMPERKSV